MEQPGANTSGSIKPINRQSIHRICSGQVILDLATAIKELVENALDAGATNIEARLREYGSALVEVADNGRGVPAADYQALTLKYHTSKIASFDDLTSVSTYGFRGEALSSLCAVSELSVVTRTADQAAGVRLLYNHEGLLTGQSPAPRAVGTTVAVKNLFATMPVRHKEFMRNLKREFARAVAVLQAYALIATHARLVVTNQAGKSAARTSVFTTTGPASTYETYAATATAASEAAPAAGGSGASGGDGGALPGCLSTVMATPAGAAADPQARAELAALRDNVVAVFGGRVAESLEPLVLPEDAETGLRLVGWVSRAGCGLRGDASRQFFFLNGRPVDLPKAARILNDSFKSLSSPAHAASCRPMAVVAVRLAAADVDVNVTPDKRRVFMAAEDRLLTLMQQALQALWEPSRCTFAVNQPLPAGVAGTTGGGGSTLVAAAGGSRRGVLRQQQLSVRRSTAVSDTQGMSDVGSELQLNEPQLVDAQGTLACDTAAEEPEGPHSARAAKRARLDGGGAGGAGASSPLALLHAPEPDDAAVEPSPGAAAASATALAGAASQLPRQQSPAGGRMQRPIAALMLASGSPPAAQVPFRHPFLSMLSSFAAGAGKGRSNAPMAHGSDSTDRTEGHTIRERPGERLKTDDFRNGIRENVGADGRMEDEDAAGGGAVVSVEGGRAGAPEAKQPTEAPAPMDVGRWDKGEDVDMRTAAIAGDDDEAELEEDAGDDSRGTRSDPRASKAAPGIATAAAAGRTSARALDAWNEPELLAGGKGVQQDGERAIAMAGQVSDEAAAQQPDAGATLAAASTLTAAAAAAVLRLEPGQLAELTAARARHLRAQQEQWRRRQEAAVAIGNGAGDGMAAGRRFANASLLEDGVDGGGGAVGVEGGGGGGVTRAEREAAAERELERVFRKHQFREMRVLGQFNLGFILARHGADVFIVDQHAAAEKTTFERLQRTVVLTRQRLLAPRPLPPGLLLPVDQLIIREHIDVFRRNGFDFVERRPDGRLLPLPGATRRSGGDERRIAVLQPPAPQTCPTQSPTQVQKNSQQRQKQSQQQEQIEAQTEDDMQPSEPVDISVEGGTAEAAEAEAAGPSGILSGDSGDDQGEGWACDEGGGADGGGNEGAEPYDAYGDAGGELLLSSVPVSRATGQLDMEDVVELVGLLKAGEGPMAAGSGAAGGQADTNTTDARQRAWEEELRPSRVRAMLASRACRSSVMVGKPLSRAEMRRLLDGLAELRQPWNCPHGRPTMRHVCVLPDPPGLPPS